MNGPELISAVRRIDHDARIVAVTGLDNEMNRSRADTAGVTQLLLKPYTAELLLETVYRVLRNHAGPS